MISKDEALELLHSTETYRIEKTTSTEDMDKLCETICAFGNDMPGSRKKGYVFIGANDDGSLSGLKADDALLKKIADFISGENILSSSFISVERFVYPEGDLLVVEVSPSIVSLVLYHGKAFVRMGSRQYIASEAEKRLLTKRCTARIMIYDTRPCFGTTINDLNLDYIKKEYMPLVVPPEILAEDKRDIKEQLISIYLYDRDRDCPTYAAILHFGKNHHH